MLITSRLPESSRSPIRFVIVGTLGTIIQYAIYYGFLELFHYCFPKHNLVSLAFSLGFVLEMIVNYLLQSYYVFEQKPNWQNAAGFLVARGFNYFIQIGVLQLFLMWQFGAKVAGIIAILIAGVINYFMLKVLYKNEKIKRFLSPRRKTHDI